MIAASSPRSRDQARLLRIDPCQERLSDGHLGDLPEILRPGDLLVLNDAATFPASFRLTIDGDPVELRLAGPLEHGRCRAVLFGAGDWRTPTEHRPPPPPLAAGRSFAMASGVTATVEEVSPLSPRLIMVSFAPDDDALPARLFAAGRPVQYSHLLAPLDLWDVQTAYSSRPWAVEAPSAGLNLSVATLVALRRHGVELAALTHAAGLSATGDPALDAALPLPERYYIPATTASAIQSTRGRGRGRGQSGRVVAVGTTVVRALEGAYQTHGALRPGDGVTDLRIGPGFRPQVVDGLLTGLHEPGSSHIELLRAFVSPPILDAAYAHAIIAGYRGHELGDTSLVLCS